MLIQFTTLFVLFSFIVCSDKKESGIPTDLKDYVTKSFENSGLLDYKDWTQCSCLMAYNHGDGKVTTDPFRVSIEFRLMQSDEIRKFIEPVKKLKGCIAAAIYGDYNIEAYFVGKTFPLSDISEIFKDVKNVSITTDFVASSTDLCGDSKFR